MIIRKEGDKHIIEASLFEMKIIKMAVVKVEFDGMAGPMSEDMAVELMAYIRKEEKNGNASTN